MSRGRPIRDVVVIGAGPVGCTAALAHAESGARVLLLEANPRAAERLAGEWLHPPGVEVLRSLGIDLRSDLPYDSGRGFVVFPEDGSPSVHLPYANGAMGWSGEHRALVSLLRERAADHPQIELRVDTRVNGIEDQRVTYHCSRTGKTDTATVDRIVGADGRASRARRALGLPAATTTISRMAGLLLRVRSLPADGFGHVFLGAPGPMLMYRIDEERVRLCLDVPLGMSTDAATLWDAYSQVLPASLRPAFRQELVEGAISWAANQVRPRTWHGRDGLFLVGDSVGYSHPLTAVGMTLGMADAATLASHTGFSAWRRERRRDTRVAELLGSVLHEVFTGEGDALVAMRQGVYEHWRRCESERLRSMQYISAEPGQLAAFTRTFARVAGRSLTSLAVQAIAAGEHHRAVSTMRELFVRAGWLASGALLGHRTPAVSAVPITRMWPEPISTASDRTSSATSSLAPSKVPPSALLAVERGVDRLVSLQCEATNRPGQHDGEQAALGGWEGEVVWCPMLAAQYVIFCHAMGIRIRDERRAGLFRHFERTQLESGTWGLHELSSPSLFVTALVYVAARLLGDNPSGPLLARAVDFVRAEGVVSIPSWGKLWLAIAGVYDWRGVPSVVPELWALPSALPIHPSKFYCHTRQIYLAMSVVFARRPCVEESSRLAAIRDELYAGRYALVDWTAARRALRREDLVAPPGLPLRIAYEVGASFERHHRPGPRRRILAELEERIRCELRTTDHTSLSPVSGLLNILALHRADPNDPEIKRAIERLEGWIWEDAYDGTRIAGARSASWDTAFAVQALSAAAPHCPVDRALERGVAFLSGQQIRSDGAGFAEAHRIDPDGGWCFAGVWHGWPVSDCTAEAMEALLSVPGAMPDADSMHAAARFVLRCQNPDGGFGSYESRRSRLDLEWLNPAEMFTDSMSEQSYVECTASCIAALSRYAGRFGADADTEVGAATLRAVRCLRDQQRLDGAWQGVWGVHLIYGTLFGVRGLLASGVKPGDPAIVRARRWLLERQRPDGGFGESHTGCLDGRYVESESSQVIQTAWAMIALLEAGELDWSCLGRAAEFLIAQQDDSGAWPRQEPVGLFFRTALLDYALYRQYFPLWALSLYESRRIAREKIAPRVSRRERAGEPGSAVAT